MNDLQNFKEYSLYPSLWERIDVAFPEMEFTKRGGYWRSPKHIDGSPSHSKDQTFVYHKRKDLIKDNSDSRAYSLIDFEMMRSNSDFPTAFKRLCDVCGLTPPNYDSEEWKAYEEQQKNREEANRLFVEALWAGTDGANEVLRYLREERRWTDEDIKRAELGYVDEAILSQLPDRSEFTSTSSDGGKIGSSHRLTIPYRNGSRLFGFKVRDIAVTKGQKYLNTRGLTKSAGFFGIGIGAKDITIVEGELDALHAQAKGADYVVATAGGAAGEGQIAEAINKRRCKRFTLLYDNDPNGQNFIASTIERIERQGGEVFVAALPDDVKDTDEYLASHTIEEWKSNVAQAVTATKWKYFTIRNKYVQICTEQGGDFYMKQREDFFSEVEELLNSPTTKGQNRELIFANLKDDEDTLLFKVDDVRAYFDKSYLRAKEKQRKDEAVKAVAQAQELLKGGKVDEAVKLMRETVEKAGAQDRETEYAKIFAPLAPMEMETYLSQIQEGIPTGIKFEQGTQKEPLTLNAGLTFICGYRGHGKTTFLNNIALNEVKRNLHFQNGKSVLYFSYEVDKRRLITDLLGTFVNDPELNRAKNPQDAIVAYFKGEKKWISSQTMQGSSVTHFQNFETKKREFMERYISSGALVVVEENYKVERLLDAIRYYLTIHKPSIVCIDYAQLLYSEDYSRQRTEEIKKVVNDIKDFANKQGIPFVMAAQFNRNVDSPVSVDTQNIGEGGDFERIADTCIGLFNLKELHPLAGKGEKKDEEKEAKKLLQELGVAQYQQGDSLRPIYGKLFVRLMKRRYGFYPLDIVLDWEGRTKHISLNDEGALYGQDKTEEEKDEELFSPQERDLPF